MAISLYLTAIRAQLSQGAKLLTDTSSKDFKQALERWTDLGKKTPAAIVMVATEEDVINTIKLSNAYGIPFVAKAGGHSAWSTTQGTIIDLTNFNKISIDKSLETVRIQGGAQNFQVIDALYAEGLLVPLGSGNTIGTIPLAIGGGLSVLSKLCGSTSDNILSARLVTASGDIIVVDSNTPDLLWALKGAGQFFGIVTEIEMEAYPLEILGSSDGTIWSGTLIFDIEKTQEVARICAGLMDNVENNAAVAGIVTIHPVTKEPCMLVMGAYFGRTEDAERFFAELLALGPTMADTKRKAYNRLNDGMDVFCGKGGLKHFTMYGSSEFSAEPWGEIAQIFVEMTKEIPDMMPGGFAFDFSTGRQKVAELDSAWGHREVKVWISSLSWYTDPSSAVPIDTAETKALALAMTHVPASKFHTYQNHSRTSSLQSRFGGLERVEKLKALKAKWDPNGVFSGQLVEKV